MRVVVLEGPEPIVVPFDIPGDHDGDDRFVRSMIAAAQAEIDGPTGWLGRALGVQTLEAQFPCWPCSLPYRPVIEIVSVRVDGVSIDGVTCDWDGVLRLPPHLPRGELVIHYRAGYDEQTTGSVPANAKAAVMLMVQELRAQMIESGGLRSRTVDDVLTEAFNSPDLVQKARTRAVNSLLSPLQVYA